MSVKLSASTYKQVIQEDLEALYKHMPDILERQHIEDVLKYSIKHLYPGFVDEQDKTEGLRDEYLEANNRGLRELLTKMDDDCCHLSAENSDLSSQIEGVRHDNKILRERVKELEERYNRLNANYVELIGENTRLREALERISTPIHGEYPNIETVNWIAKEALKQQDDDR